MQTRKIVSTYGHVLKRGQYHVVNISLRGKEKARSFRCFTTRNMALSYIDELIAGGMKHSGIVLNYLR